MSAAMRARWTGMAAVASAALLGLAFWLHLMPAGFPSVLGVDRAPLVDMHAALRLRPPAISFATFAWVFRGLLGVAFVAYGAMLWLIGRSAELPRVRLTLPLAAALPVVVAIVMPAVLSTDIYNYVGYARLAVVHGMNPHVAPGAMLRQLGDPTAMYVHWPNPSPYGPIWTLATMLVVAVSPARSILIPAFLLKLVGAGALVGAAAAARRIVREFDPTRADATFVAVAINPLLIIEGPGGGHNDIPAAALVMLAFLAFARRRPRTAALWVGVSIAIKLIPLALLPWLAFVAARPTADAAGSPPRSALARAGTAAAIVGLGLLPTAVGYLPFWRGLSTFDSLATRWYLAHPGGTEQPVALPSSGVVVVYLLCSLYVYRASRPSWSAGFLSLAAAWSIVAIPIQPVITQKVFPWYLTWSWNAALLRWSRAGLALLVWLWPISFLLLSLYSIARL